MQLNIFADAADLLAALRNKASKFPQIVKKGVIDATVVMFTGSHRRLTEMIYNVPIPKLRRWRQRIRSGKRAGKWRRFRKERMQEAWRRTGTLLRNERYYFRGSGADVEGIIDNKTEYAKPRHDLNRPSRIDGKIRRAPWRTATLLEDGEKAKRTFRDAIRAAED